MGLVGERVKGIGVKKGKRRRMEKGDERGTGGQRNVEKKKRRNRGEEKEKRKGRRRGQENNRGKRRERKRRGGDMINKMTGEEENVINL